MDWDATWNLVKEIWPHLVATLTFAIDLAAAAHVVLKKARHPIGDWLGGNHLAGADSGRGAVRAAGNQSRSTPRADAARRARRAAAPFTCAPDQLAQLESPHAAHLATFVKMVGELTNRPLLEGQHRQAALQWRRGLSRNAASHRRGSEIGDPGVLYF